MKDPKTIEKDKEKFLDALKQNKGQVDEISLGKKLGFNKEQTDKILDSLLSDEKIEYNMQGVCTYKPTE
jgi:hypothetical protein